MPQRVLTYLHLFVIFFGFLGSTSRAQRKEERGRPFHHYYPPKEYQASTQNWFSAQAENGLMYFANNLGLVEFDGTFWKTHTTGNNTTMRSIHIDGESQRIYVGGQGEFGFFSRDEKGTLVFEGLGEKLPDPELTYNDVWGILETPYGIIFSSNEALFFLKEDKLTVLEAPSGNFFDRRTYFVNDRLLVNQNGKGLLEYKNGTFEPVAGLEDLGNESMAFILPAKNDEILIGLRNGNIFLWDGAERKPFFVMENPPTFTNMLYRGSGDEEEGYVFSSLDGRVAVAAPDGSEVDMLKDQVGIASSVFYAHFDRERDLWISLDKGIVKVEYSSTLSKWDKQSGLKGNVTGAVRHQGKIFAHTSDNHFVLEENNRFYPLSKDEKQSWNGKSITLPGGKKTLLLANNGGVFEFKDGKLSIIAGVNNNSTSIIQDRSNPEIFYAGSNEGVTVIRYDTGNWTRLRFIEVSPLIRNMVQAVDGSLWAGTYGSGYVHVIAPLSPTPKVKVYNDDKYGIPVKYLFETFVYQIGKELVFANGGGVHRWTGEVFEVDERFEDYFLFTESRHVNWVGKKGNYIWISGFNTRQTPVAKAKMVTRNEWEWELIPELQRLPEALENFLYVEADGKLWTANSEGLFLYNPIEKFELTPLLPVLIREVVVNDSLLFSQYDGTKTPPPLELNSDQRSVIFRYALPFFESEQANLYQFKLETKNESSEWSPWTTETKKEYSNLWEGKYTFSVRGRNALGQVSEASTIRFSIAPPWFRTWWAYLGYVIIAALTLFLSIQWNTRRVRRKNKQLEQTVADRTKQIQEQTVELRKEKQKVERAFENVKTLSDIGQKITAQLDTEQLIKEVYANVNELMPAEAFGIGVLNRERQQLEFRGFMEEGEELPFDAESLNDVSSPAVRCYHTQEEVFINDVDNELRDYLDQVELKAHAGKIPQSVIYLPLVVEDTSLGVLTVQSFEKNTYGERDLTFLRTLGSYVSIALANSRMYTNIQKENRRTIDSLRYAQTIQNAVLPPAEELSRIGCEYFVLFRPRDIVSGDFYWAAQVDETWFVVVADCTGHGVPGAFMSMIGNTLLNEIVIERAVREPAEILENLHLELRNALHQEGGANEDGMDISLCRIKDNEIVYSGASQSLIYYDAGEKQVKKYRGTRRSIGGRQRGRKAFEQETFVLEKGSTLYLYTDGIIDQNSPEGGRKFGSMKFFELIKRIVSLPLKEQGHEIQEALNSHQRSMEQRDDISVLGIRL